MREDVVARASHFDEDARVGDDDGQTRHEEAESEEEFFGRSAVLLENGAREGRLFQSQFAPDAGQRGHHHAETEEPRAADHQRHVRQPVDATVPRRPSDQDVSVN